MAKQSFSSGQTLTAQQMSDLQANDFNLTATTKTGDATLVVGDRGTRVIGNAGTAITFTVPNSTFTAGDSVQVHNIGAGTVTIAAGTGLTLDSADVLTLGQYQSGTIYFTSASAALLFPTAKTVTSSSGLTLISATTIGSAVSSVTVSSAFSATYDNYLILINNGTCSANGLVGLKFGSVAANYYGASVTVGQTGTVSGAANNNAAALLNALHAQTTAFNAVLNVNNPFLSGQTFVSANSFGSNDLTNFFAGKLAESSSQTAFTLTPASGTMTGGTIRVYGFANS